MPITSAVGSPVHLARRLSTPRDDRAQIDVLAVVTLLTESAVTEDSTLPACRTGPGHFWAGIAEAPVSRDRERCSAGDLGHLAADRTSSNARRRSRVHGSVFASPRDDARALPCSDLPPSIA